MPVTVPAVLAPVFPVALGAPDPPGKPLVLDDPDCPLAPEGDAPAREDVPPAGRELALAPLPVGVPPVEDKALVEDPL
jgi:hypothetical protein